MGVSGILLQQCEGFTMPVLSLNIVNRDRLAAVVSSPSQVSRLFSSGKKVSGARQRQAVKSRFQSGRLPLRNSPSNATDRTPGARRSVRCKARCAGRREEVEDYGYDLYELLGVERDAEAEDIKRAYRWLQKRCHPDIAGVKGHDMAILLNEAYAVLSDPYRRLNYDAIIAEKDEFEGYTGNPLYSKWYGKPGESRAVFVEETRCIGCLKCALIAPNTFAIEAKHGRARAVGQWLDDEGTVKDAIRACPVDCIFWVKKDMLPALEFIMSKQPRLNMGVNNFSYVGVRRENVFNGAVRFLEKYNKREEVQTSSFQETPAQREARLAAVEQINIKAGRWWWHDMMGFPNLTFSNLRDPESTKAIKASQGAMVHIPSTGSSGPKTIHIDEAADLGPLLEAAKERKRRGTTGSRRGTTGSSKAAETFEEEEYWTPNEPISCPLPVSGRKRSPSKSESDSNSYVFVGQWSKGTYNFRENLDVSLRQIMSAVPIAVSVTAAVLVGMNGGGSDLPARSETSFISGPLPASMTSGPEMQLMLTAVVWYMIGAVVCEVAVFIMTSALVTYKKKTRSKD